MMAFRSLVVPLTAAVMNPFAAGASFGIVVAIFQWGWFSEALGIGSGGPVEAFLPVMFFAILFGLSIDYQVFLDAFILRTILVPALMHMFGPSNWYFPKWLDKLTPRVSVESADGEPAPATALADLPPEQLPTGAR
jgi:uncharacterized membrane protein YdfJ with MMPL/SSD domain